MDQSRYAKRCLWSLVSLCALLAGCANFQIPRIDPSGERFFLPNEPIATPASPLLAAPGALGPVAFQEGISVNPRRIIAPVGSEVVMIASVCGNDGFMVTDERVEWMIAPGGVGQFVAIGERGTFDYLNLWRGLPQKLDNTYAVNTTVSDNITLDRGTPTPIDDVVVQSGQSWVTVTSPVEGTSYVTAYAPAIYGWDRRQQAATIHWIDAQFAFPPPAINPVGTRHTFTTGVTRQSDGAPIAGWIVRYEIAGGPEAGFAPDGATAVEVITDAAGQASADIFQTRPAGGTNQINIQVIRPPGATTGDTQRLVVGNGATMKTWTSSDITLRVVGPATATVGSTATYRIEVTNPGGIPARDVVVTDQAPPGLSYLNSNPAANSSPSGQEWRLDQLGARETRVLEANFRVVDSGSLTYCASVTAAEGLTARGCATTVASAPAAQLKLEVTGPETAIVGEEVRFVVQVTNIGQSAVTGLTVTDRFDPGLAHTAASSPIVRDLPDLPPGESTRFGVAFRVEQVGVLCQDIEVTSAGGSRASARRCLTATALQPTPGADTQSPADATETPAPAGQAELTVKMTGPEQRRVGEIAEFVIEVTNTGGVPLTNLRITDNYEPALEPRQATEGAQLTSSGLVWTVDSLIPGRTIRRQINCVCLQESPSACNRVTVTAEPGIVRADEACLEIVGAGPTPSPVPGDQDGVATPVEPAGTLTVSIVDQVDPVRVGSETTYRIVVTNTSESADKNVRISVALPPEIEVQRVAGRVRAAFQAGGVEFQPIEELGAGESASFEVIVRAKQAGTATVRAEVSSERQPRSVEVAETTEILQ